EKKEKKEIGVKKKKSGKPALLQGDEEIETKNGRMTVSSLYKVDFGEKIICRLNWVSTSSLNAWCNRLEDGSLKFFLNVEKYLDARHSHV
ncbi:MAG TPA: hypothetical protein DF712_06810, partial [Balneola sp.]|nr:hypothetical protein [Balneola sp.]